MDDQQAREYVEIYEALSGHTAADLEQEEAQAQEAARGLARDVYRHAQTCHEVACISVGDGHHAVVHALASKGRVTQVLAGYLVAIKELGKALAKVDELEAKLATMEAEAKWQTGHKP